MLPGPNASLEDKTTQAHRSMVVTIVLDGTPSHVMPIGESRHRHSLLLHPITMNLHTKTQTRKHIQVRCANTHSFFWCTIKPANGFGSWIERSMQHFSFFSLAGHCVKFTQTNFAVVQRRKCNWRFTSRGAWGWGGGWGWCCGSSSYESFYLLSNDSFFCCYIIHRQTASKLTRPAGLQPQLLLAAAISAKQKVAVIRGVCHA